MITLIEVTSVAVLLPLIVVAAAAPLLRPPE